MCLPRTYVAVFFLVLTVPAFAQQAATALQSSVQRDPQAVALVQQSVAAMASTLPSDSSATGIVTIVEGSTSSSGTIQILTRGTTETVETVTLSAVQRSVIFSNGDAKEVVGSQSTNPSLELAVSDQCPDFPLPLLLAALNSPDFAFRYVGQETLDSVAAQHIQMWNTFSSNSHLKHLALFSLRDIWFDATSSLPLKMSYTRRAGKGATPAVPVEISFANFTKVNGVLYPFLIHKSLNGTPWQTITIENVSFNTGLTASQFQVE